MSLSSDQDPEMLQANASLTAISDDAKFSGPEDLAERPHRVQRSHKICRVDDGERWRLNIMEPDRSFPEAKHSVVKTVLSVKPFDNLAHKLSRQRYFIERPPFDAPMDVHRNAVGCAGDCVNVARPHESNRRGRGARLLKHRPRIGC